MKTKITEDIRVMIADSDCPDEVGHVSIGTHENGGALSIKTTNTNSILKAISLLSFALVMAAKEDTRQLLLTVQKLDGIVSIIKRNVVEGITEQLGVDSPEQLLEMIEKINEKLRGE